MRTEDFTSHWRDWRRCFSDEMVESFKLPRRSGVIDPVVFWFYADASRVRLLPTRYDSIVVGELTIKTFEPWTWLVTNERLPSALCATSRETGILYCFFLRNVFELAMKRAATQNVKNLVRGKFPLRAVEDAVSEIENQLQYVDPRVGATRCKYGKLAVFHHFEQWKKSRTQPVSCSASARGER